jgi:hypothetical protein
MFDFLLIHFVYPTTSNPKFFGNVIFNIEGSYCDCYYELIYKPFKRQVKLRGFIDLVYCVCISLMASIVLSCCVCVVNST